ncbi:hypothetical protein B0H19DRAFT_650964 [Mycena capillaripes]|nr:hypothetical protein B0H19DRAFT_650964 [Mycena capillaripes]
MAPPPPHTSTTYITSRRQVLYLFPHGRSFFSRKQLPFHRGMGTAGRLYSLFIAPIHVHTSRPWNILYFSLLFIFCHHHPIQSRITTICCVTYRFLSFPILLRATTYQRSFTFFCFPFLHHQLQATTLRFNSTGSTISLGSVFRSTHLLFSPFAAERASGGVRAGEALYAHAGMACCDELFGYNRLVAMGGSTGYYAVMPYVRTLCCPRHDLEILNTRVSDTLSWE